MRRSGIILSLLGLLSAEVKGQGLFPVNGAPHPAHTVFAFTHANLYIDYETLITDASLIIKDGKVLAAGQKVDIPEHAVLTDLHGKYIYPSFIDLYSDYGMPDSPVEKTTRQGPQMESNIKGAYGWNQAIHAEADACKLVQHQKDKAYELKKSGFGLVLSHKKDGIVRGSGVLICLAGKKENECILMDKAAGFYSFHKGSSTQDYPSSLTGAIALLRQTYYDAAWYRNNKGNIDFNISLNEFNALQSLPSVFECNDKYNVLRAARIGKEFGVSYIVKGSGNEYQRLAEMKESGLKFIIPLNFPEAYDVEDPFDAEMISLADMKHWELAPRNPAFLESRFIPFAITASDVKSSDQFLKNLRKALLYGLSEKAALKALTYSPASFMNVQDRVGALKPGYYANFFICNKSVFTENADILQHWVLGEASTFSDPAWPDIRNTYELNIDQFLYKIVIAGSMLKPEGHIQALRNSEQGQAEAGISPASDSLKKKLSLKFEYPLLTFSFPRDTGSVRLSGIYHEINKSFSGKAQWPDGKWTGFTLQPLALADSTKQEGVPPSEQKPNLGEVIYPFCAYGEALPESEGLFRDNWIRFKNRYQAILIKNATIWTNCGDTILQDHDVYIVEGKIVRIAPNIEAPKLAYAKVIDAKGMHLTPGIIDEHSHIALSGGVNEGTEASSAEVRMGDVINPDDINIYRQLSGGVTTAQLLHGSANPIGGQSVLIKLRWGQAAEDMKYEKAAPFIKFALGENVKQSNWGDRNVIRFPQSRMGVEQVYMDFFTRAKEYAEKYNVKENDKLKLRRDLELEALAEILAGQRYITCHSYVQSEINMLMHVADSLGFKVNTFTHILEGYKVADKMKAHAVNASTFSDWWAYKNEVMEAIPYNAAILTRMGVNTAINSDDAEMARRLNQEAAKSMKYGGLSETDALKLVTLNPARMLHIDNKVGSIKTGKVADLVLWTDHPLSVYAKADKTIIDGLIYFDREEDARLRDYIRRERARLCAKMMAEKQKGAKTQTARLKQPKLYHCDDRFGYEEIMNHEENHMLK
ncbi:MAG TPA: amidohydrolase family protein [Bacteroidia bacterium]|nr:amidohydrolase family protein [Bacteroidia bacterium]